MGLEFKETAHLNTDTKKYNASYDRIFGKKMNCENCNENKKCKVKDDKFLCPECTEFTVNLRVAGVSGYEA